jgi:farnesyl diphosphate synthase
MTLNEAMEHYRARVNEQLARTLPDPGVSPTRLHQAMRHAVLLGGKRVRPLLVYFTGKALEVADEWLDAPACAVELIHAYSLAHDDLPAMDNDILRRGQPTCHKAFDEASAILAGDALQTLAFQVLAGAPEISPPARLEMVATLALASGSRGMAGGQALDIEGAARTLVELENLHIHKTGALIRASVKLGALCQPALSPGQMEQLDHYAKCIGLAFQIQDDVLDRESDTATLGKTQGKDAQQGKPTYPALLGLAEARRMAGELVEQALASLEGFGPRADPLRWLASYIVSREH